MLTKSVWVFVDNFGGNIWFLSHVFMSGICIASDISFFSTCENKQENFYDLSRTFDIVVMQGWFLYISQWVLK